MLDANGCNTTASAAVVAASRHVDLSGCKAVVRRLSVIQRRRQHDIDKSIARSRDGRLPKVTEKVTDANVSPMQLLAADLAGQALSDADIVIACGAAGIALVDQKTILAADSLKVAIDLNAVPPAGIGGLGVTDKAKPIGSGVGYGSIGVGGLKMKTQRAAIESSNDRVLDANEIYAIAKTIG